MTLVLRSLGKKHRPVCSDKSGSGRWCLYMGMRQLSLCIPWDLVAPGLLFRVGTGRRMSVSGKGLRPHQGA